MVNLFRALIDAPLIRLFSRFRAWSYVRTSIPPATFVWHVQSWCRAIVGLAACFLVSRFTPGAVAAGMLFFVWIVGIFAISTLAIRATDRTWNDAAWRSAALESGRRREGAVSERATALLMIAVSMLVLGFFVVRGEPTGFAFGMCLTGLAMAETSRCYILAADPPPPALRG